MGEQMPGAEKKRLRWYAVRCQGNRAVSVAEAEIKRLGIKLFIPRAYRMEKRGKWLVAVDDGMLFPPFIFVAMRAPGHWKSRESILWGLLAEARGVNRIMGNRNASGDRIPVPIPYREMRKIRTKDREGDRRRIEVRFKPGQKVRMASGPFEGFDGVFDMPEGERVKVLLSIFGRETTYHAPEDEVRAA